MLRLEESLTSLIKVMDVVAESSFVNKVGPSVICFLFEQAFNKTRIRQLLNNSFFTRK